MPLAKNKITATSEGHWNVDNPKIPWPLVQPFPYLVPKPTRKPPPITISKCCHVKRWAQLKISVGKSVCVFEIPNEFRVLVVASERGIGVTGFNSTPPIKPPIKSPAAKNRFHNCSFQLYFRKGTSPGKQIAHTWRKLLEMPSILFPASKRRGTVKPIIGPATYHGQGWRRKSNRFKI